MTGLPSPAPSALSQGNASLGLLPIARSHPLLPGSAKFNTLRNYLDTRVYEINSKLSKSYAGYSTFTDVHRDLNAAIDVLWISSTPALQVPFLITLSGLFQSSLGLFPWDSIRSLELASKLDEFFAHVLSDSAGSDEGAVNNTDRARISSIVSLQNHVHWILLSTNRLKRLDWRFLLQLLVHELALSQSYHPPTTPIWKRE